MNRRERTLLTLTIVAFVVPNIMVALFTVRHGLTVDGYLRHWGESLPAAQLAVDVGIIFVTFALLGGLGGETSGDTFMVGHGSGLSARGSLLRGSALLAAARARRSQAGDPSPNVGARTALSERRCSRGT
jgi:hypothetical protein